MCCNRHLNLHQYKLNQTSVTYTLLVVHFERSAQYYDLW